MSKMSCTFVLSMRELYRDSTTHQTHHTMIKLISFYTLTIPTLVGVCFLAFSLYIALGINEVAAPLLTILTGIFHIVGWVGLGRLLHHQYAHGKDYCPWDSDL